MLDKLKSILYFLFLPFQFLFIQIPNFIQKIFYTTQKHQYKITRPNCIFIINPKSGKKLGKTLYELLPEFHDKKYIINLLDGNYCQKIEQFLKEVPENENLNIIIAGGDGTISSLIQEFQQKIKFFERLIFAPFPLGCGNDLSLMLNLGGNMDLHYIKEFLDKLNSEKTNTYLVDTWTINFDYGNIQEEKIMLLYLGIGCDGSVAKTLDTIRKQFPFFFQMNKITRLGYALSQIRHWIPELLGLKNTKLTNHQLFTDGKVKDVNDLANLIFINSPTRQGGVIGEWNKNLLNNKKYSQFIKRDDQDEILEVFGLKSYTQLAWVTLKFQSIINFDQGKSFRLNIGDQPFTYHIDGEPFTKQGPVAINLNFRKKIKMLKYFPNQLIEQKIQFNFLYFYEKKILNNLSYLRLSSRMYIFI